MLRNLSIVLFFAALLSGCVEAPRATPVVLPNVESLRDSIQKKLEAGDLAEAYRMLLSDQRAQSLAENDREQLSQAIVKAAEAEFGAALGVNDYTKAAFWASLHPGEEATGKTLWNRFLYETAKQFLASKHDLPALITISRMSDLALIPANERVALQEKAKLLGQGTISARLSGIGVQTAEIVPIERLLKGTVTIIVDKGFKMTQGMGIPDRVIGSGFFIDNEGHLITNYHVISSEVDPRYEGYSRLYIKLNDATSTKIPAKVIGYDKRTDLALLKTEIQPAYFFPLDSFSGMASGQRVYSLGSPAGLENTVTSGIVSAMDRRFFETGNAFQVDAPLNPGNSGGPLVNEQGQLLGVVFAGIEPFEGINFAIPASLLRRILPRMYSGGELSYAWAGLQLTEQEQGIEVLYVFPGSPAEHAGLQSGDLVKALDAVAVKTVPEAHAYLQDRYINSVIRLTVVRNGNQSFRTLILEKRPDAPLATILETTPRIDQFLPLFGFTARKTGEGFFQEDFIVERVVPGSPADEAGISGNDSISLRNWQILRREEAVLGQFYVKRKKAGYLEGLMQMAASLRSPDIL